MSARIKLTEQEKNLDLLKKEVRQMQEITLVALEEAEKSLDLIIAESDDYFINPEKYALQIEIPTALSFSSRSMPLKNSIRQIQ